MKRILVAVVLACVVSFSAGCSSEPAKGGDPKLGSGQQPDPRLKPSETSSGQSGAMKGE